MAMKTVKVAREHLAGIALLEKECFKHPASERSLALLLLDTAVGFVCLDDDGTPASYAGMLTVLDEGQIINVATRAKYRRRGLAKKLLLALICEARVRALKSLSLEVRRSNLAAICLYQRLGFFVAGERRNFYNDPREDALIMICNL